jgi:hypothetical protein
MDKLTKGILTVIAVGVIGINVQMLNGGSGFITKANASTHIQKVQICSSTGNCAYIYKSGELSIYDKNN